MATIALVDDEQSILTLVSMLLEKEGYHVRTFSDGASALTALSATPPDLAILDIKMPRMDGMELLRRLRQNTDVPVIFLTVKDEEIDELMGLNAGADDYIRKPFSQRMLLERIKAVLRRAERQKRNVSASPKDKKKALVRGRLVLDLEHHECTWGGIPVRLTVTEFLLLQCLAQRPGFVKSRDSLMDAAYDDQVYVDDRTIDSHVRRIRKKFEQVDETFQAIKLLYGVGYRFVESCTIDEARPTPSERLVRGPLMLDPGCRECTWYNRLVPLTNAEFLILYCLAEHPGRTESCQTLIDAANSTGVPADNRTVAAHIKSLCKKFRRDDYDFDGIEKCGEGGYCYRSGYRELSAIGSR